MAEDRFNGRNADGTFSQGNAGKPRGARNKATLAVLDLLDGQVEALTNAAIQKALDGDTTAMRLCLERIVPARKDSPVSFELPEISTAEEAAHAAQSVLTAVSAGEITPLEGASVMGLIEQFRRVLEASELERRVTELEAGK